MMHERHQNNPILKTYQKKVVLNSKDGSTIYTIMSTDSMANFCGSCSKTHMFILLIDITNRQSIHSLVGVLQKLKIKKAEKFLKVYVKSPGKVEFEDYSDFYEVIEEKEKSSDASFFYFCPDENKCKDLVLSVIDELDERRKKGDYTEVDSSACLVF